MSLIAKSPFLLLRVSGRVLKCATFSAVMWGQLSCIGVPLRCCNCDVCTTVISMICVHWRGIIESRCGSKCDDKVLLKRACWVLIHSCVCWQRSLWLHPAAAFVAFAGDGPRCSRLLWSRAAPKLFKEKHISRLEPQAGAALQCRCTSSPSCWLSYCLSFFQTVGDGEG